jgi:DNA-binding GntR family transcriptional regulator
MTTEQTTEPVERKTLATLVTEQIRKGIIDGAFPPGSQLSDVELANRFGVSRGPVREGVERLIQEGLLRREPHRRVSVPTIGHDDIVDIYFSRESIETAAIRRVIRSDRRAAVGARLLEIVGTMRSASDSADWLDVADLDMAFHRAVVDGAGSARLSRMYATLLDESRICLRLAVLYPTREDLADEHHEIADPIAAGDLDAAVAACAKHCAESIEGLMRHLAAADRSRGDAP